MRLNMNEQLGAEVGAMTGEALLMLAIRKAKDKSVRRQIDAELERRCYAPRGGLLATIGGQSSGRGW